LKRSENYLRPTTAGIEMGSSVESGSVTMRLKQQHLWGGRILAIGASLVLLIKAYWLLLSWTTIGLTSWNFHTTRSVLQSLLGDWISPLVSYFANGESIELHWNHFFWFPWSAIVLIFVLRMAVKVIKEQVALGRVQRTIYWFLGLWFSVLVQRKMEFSGSSLSDKFKSFSFCSSVYSPLLTCCL